LQVQSGALGPFPGEVRVEEPIPRGQHAGPRRIAFVALPPELALSRWRHLNHADRRRPTRGGTIAFASVGLQRRRRARLRNATVDREGRPSRALAFAAIRAPNWRRVSPQTPAGCIGSAIRTRPCEPRYRRPARFCWPGGERPGVTGFVRIRSPGNGSHLARHGCFDRRAGAPSTPCRMVALDSEPEAGSRSAGSMRKRGARRSAGL
jgi:hypothetical protein